MQQQPLEVQDLKPKAPPSPPTVTADLNRSLSLLQRILLATDGTVTDLIALITGEPIRVKRLEQWIRKETPPEKLACEHSVELLTRKILLSGPSKNYLYAESLFVFERLSPAIQRQLLTTDRPIGLMWKEERLESYREIIEQKIEPCPEIAAHFDLDESAPFASRTYIVHRLH